MVAFSSQLEEVLRQVESWPAETRLALARRVLESLEGHAPPETLIGKGPPSSQVLGLWNTGGAVPTDEECEQILAEELDRKHAP